MRNGKLSLVEPTSRGGSGETTGDDDRSKHIIGVPHYQRDDSIAADEVQNVREFGTESSLENLEGRVNRKAQRHARDLTMTLEHQRVGAIKGIVTSKSGGVLVDLYNLFGLAVPAAVSLELDVDSTVVTSLWQDVIYSLEDSLDEAYGGIRVLPGAISTRLSGSTNPSGKHSCTIPARPFFVRMFRTASSGAARRGSDTKPAPRRRQISVLLHRPQRGSGGNGRCP